MNLGHKVAERRFHCKVPGDDWHPVLSILFMYWVYGGTTWFNARRLGRGPPEYVWEPVKTQTMSPQSNFNNVRPQLTCVVGIVCDAFYCMWQLVFANIINNRIEPCILHHILMCAHLLCILINKNTRHLAWYMILLQWSFFTVYLCTVLSLHSQYTVCYYIMYMLFLLFFTR